MSLVIPNTLGSRTASIELADLDENFEYFRDELNPYVNAITVGAANAVTLNGTTTLSSALTYGGVTLANTVTGTGSMVLSNSPTITGTLSLTSSTASTSTTTGTAIITGGLGVAGAIHAGSVNTNTLRATTGSVTTVPTGNAVKGTDVGSLYAPGMIIQTIYKRVDARDVVSFATAGQTGSFIESLDTVITPKFANSLILIQMCLTYEVHNDTVFRLYRGTTPIGINANDSNYWSGTWLPGYDADNNSTAVTNHFFYMDAPATTNATTYRLMIQSAGIGATSLYLNRTVGAVGQANYEVAISQIIIQEIAQ
jgi:hypothetical protein